MSSQGVQGDLLHTVSPPATWWTTVNIAEAVPGVPTPLGWTFWTDAMEWAAQASFCDVGVLARSQIVEHPPIERCFASIFYGRVAINLDTMKFLAEHMPGNSPERFEEQFFGSTGRADLESHQSRRRYPVMAVKLPIGVALLSRQLARLRARSHEFWRSSTARQLDEHDARALFEEARARFKPVVRRHGVATFVAQAAYEQVRRVAANAGCEGLEATIVSGYGGLEEANLVADLWDVSRDRLSLEEFLGRHGYHGPNEGELSTRSWREDPTPVRALVDTYRTMGEDESPAALETRAVRAREAAERELLGALRGAKRVEARAVIRLARRFVPLREVGKAAFLQVLDVVRASARAVGTGLAERGLIDDPEDAFYLAMDEVRAPSPPPDVRALVEFRRARRAEYLELEIPSLFRGQPEPIRIETQPATEVGQQVVGLAVAPGIVEGTARVVADPAEVETFEPGDILVTRTTDPSWVSLFLIAGALVIDIGGVLSHGAIAARELGIPCVIGTQDGTRRLRTGDVVRVDGIQGFVEVLARHDDDVRSA